MLSIEDLSAQLKQKGWQPSRKQAVQLMALLATVERDDAEIVTLALRRMKGELPALVLPLLANAVAPQRARLVNLLDEYLKQPEGRDLLLSLLADADGRTERVAIGIAGKLDATLAPVLLARWTQTPAPPPETLRALAYALGQMGDTSARAVLEGARASGGDAELQRIAGEALLKLERRLVRTEDSGSIFAAGVIGTGTEIFYRCRRGLEPWVAEEAGGTVVGPERVALRSNRSLADLSTVRTALDFVVPLPVGDPELPIEDAVFAALTATATRTLLTRLTHGAVRFRIEWAEAGKKRAQTMKLAARLRDAAPELLNDPTASLWQVDVSEKPERRIELVPKALPDPRFVYRQADVVGSSHPTIAAALAWVAEPRGGDVVWDPFVGGGTELIEIARRAAPAMVKELYGSDVSEHALLRARLNVDAAGVPATLVRADATTWLPPLAPTLIVSNPPMGRRVLDKERVTELMQKFLQHAARVLAPGGRIVWLTPRADDAKAASRSLGLTIELTRKVDLGGFSAEMQVMRKGGR